MHKAPLMSIQFLPAPAYISIVVQMVCEVAGTLGFDSESSTEISLACEEAIHNAIELGHDASRNLQIELLKSSKGMNVRLQSESLPLNPEQLAQYDPQQLHAGDTAGLSFLLMKKMMDQVSFTFLPGGNREALLIKHLREGLATQAPFHQEEDHDRDDSLSGKIRFTVRPLLPDEAEDVSRLALKAHGTVFFCEDIYYPERVSNLNESKEMLHPPERHREMIEQIYRNAGIALQFSNECPPDPISREHASVSALTNFNEGWTWIAVEEYGLDILSQVSVQLEHACHQKLPAVFLQLPLTSPHTATLCEEFEKLGFFFCGVGPGDDGREILMLQYVNLKLDYASIRIYSEFGKKSNATFNPVIRAQKPTIPNPISDVPSAAGRPACGWPPSTAEPRR